jgi:hypothetical protein
MASTPSPGSWSTGSRSPGSCLPRAYRSITAQLIEAATDTDLWADRFERDGTSMLSLKAEIARAIATGSGPRTDPQRQFQAYM